MGSTPSSNVAGHFTFVWEAKCIVINGAPILVLNNVTNHTTNTDTIQILTIYSFSFCFHFSFIFWSASLTRVSYGSQWFVIFVFHFFFSIHLNVFGAGMLATPLSFLFSNFIFGFLVGNSLCERVRRGYASGRRYMRKIPTFRIRLSRNKFYFKWKRAMNEAARRREKWKKKNSFVIYYSFIQ